LHEIAARRPLKPWCRNQPPNQCADNNNFQKRPDMVPSSLILPSENPPLFAQKADFRFCAERADLLREHCQEIRRQRRITLTANLQSGCRIRADLTYIPRRPMRGKAPEKRMGFDNDRAVNMRPPCKHPGAMSILSLPQTRRWSGRAARRSDRQESGVGGPLVCGGVVAIIVPLRVLHTHRRSFARTARPHAVAMLPNVLPTETVRLLRA